MKLGRWMYGAILGLAFIYNGIIGVSAAEGDGSLQEPKQRGEQPQVSQGTQTYRTCKVKDNGLESCEEHVRPASAFGRAKVAVQDFWHDVKDLYRYETENKDAGNNSKPKTEPRRKIKYDIPKEKTLDPAACTEWQKTNGQCQQPVGWRNIKVIPKNAWNMLKGDLANLWKYIKSWE